MNLSTKAVTLANRLGASFHAAVRAARNEWRGCSRSDECVHAKCECMVDVAADAHGMGQEQAEKDIGDWLAEQGADDVADKVSSGEWRHVSTVDSATTCAYCGLAEGHALMCPSVATNWAARPAPGCTPAHVCEPNHWSNEAGTWICNTCDGRPSHDWYQRRQEAARPAPSTTTCKDCKGPWRPGHLCSEGRTG